MASGDKFYLADKATLDEVKGKIGSTTDTGGSSTAGSVYAKLNYLVSQVSSYLSNIHTYVSRIGSTNDSQGTDTTGTVMGKLNKLINSIFNALSKIGSDDDAVTGDTVFSRLNLIKSKSGKIINTETETFMPVTGNKGTLLIPDISISNGASVTNHLVPDENYLYYPDQTSKKIQVFDKNLLLKVGETSAQTGYSYSTVVDAEYIYYADMTAKKVIKFNKITLAKVGETVAQTYNSVSIAVDDSFIYYAEYNSTTGKLIKFDKVTMEKVSDLSPTGTASFQICVDDQYLYSVNRSGGTGSFAYTVSKFNKSTLVKVKETSSRSISPNCIVMDSDYLYIAEGDTTGNAFKVVKYSKSDLSIKKETAVQSYMARTLCIDNFCVYYPDTVNLKLLAFDKETLLEVNSCKIQVGSDHMAMYGEEIFTTVIINGNRGISKYKAWEVYQIIGYRKE